MSYIKTICRFEESVYVCVSGCVRETGQVRGVGLVTYDDFGLYVINIFMNQK